MSETTTTEATETPAEAVAATETTEATQATQETTQEATEGQQQGEGEARSRGDRRFAVLTAKAAADRARLEEVERERDGLKAILDARGGETKAGTDPDPAKPHPDAVRAEAERIVAQRERERATQTVVQSGVKEFGEAAWNEKTSVVAALGATTNPAFMEALTELPDAHRLVVALADDPERLQGLLAKRPAAMAAELGRMAAELAAPKPKVLSSAPAPVKPIGGRGAAPELTVYDTDKLSMKDWIARRNKEAPPHLGGARRRAS